jgi:ABC-2 type transport system permease protein
MKNNFKGWTTVFGFTYKQATSGVGFKLITTLIALVIIGASILFNIIAAKPDKADKIVPSPINKVYVLDNSGLEEANYKDTISQYSMEQFQHIEFVMASDQTREDLIKTAASDSKQTVAVIITPNDTGYQIEVAVPSESDVTKKQAEDLLIPITSAFESNKLMQVGLSVEQLTTALKPVVTSYSDIGENSNEIAFVIKMIAPMIFGLMMYFMLLFFGQTVTKSVSTEKTSKLMETLLTSIHPYALISGKVLAVTSMAIVQFVIWIVSAFVGLFVGNAIAHQMYPGYENSVVTAINFVKDNIGETALTLPAVILALLFFCVGFLFYSVIAGLAGCMVSKPEDAASTQGIFQLPVVISWLICYLAPVMGNETVLTVVRYIPFTAPFTVPADLLTGTVGLIEGVIMLVILSIFTTLVIMLSGKLYKGLILYTGQKINFKMLGKILKATE